MMKEMLERQRAMAIEWQELGLDGRKAVLEQLEVNINEMTKSFNVEEMASNPNWMLLPWQLKMLLDHSFADGKFSRAAQEKIAYAFTLLGHELREQEAVGAGS